MENMGKNTTPLTDEQVRYIAEHRNDRPRYQVAEAAGVSLSSLYRVLRLIGADIHHELSKKRPNVEEDVRRFYPSMSAAEMQAKTGIPASTVKSWVTKLGLEHDKDTKSRLKEKTLLGLRTWSPERRKEASRRHKALYRMEYLRAMSGEKRRTKLRIAKIPARTYKVIWRLVNYLGYSKTDDLYTLERPASPAGKINEAYYEKRYRLTFKDRKTEKQKKDGLEEYIGRTGNVLPGGERLQGVDTL